jgi:hypothetical protein
VVWGVVQLSLVKEETKMKKYEVEIVGVTPYMQHRMDDQKLEEWEKNRKFIIERDDVAKEDLDRAIFHSYNDEKGFYIPSEHIRGALINAGMMVKSKVGNAKKSMRNIVAAMFFVNPEKIRLTQDMTIDKRSAVNKNIKARVISVRPKWENWSAKFELWVDNDTITLPTIKEILVNAGQYVGIGSFTPTHGGMFGRFDIKKVSAIL